MRATIEYTTLDGAPYEPLDGGIHHRDETIAGPADPLVLLRAGGLVQEWWFAAGLGFSLPLGSTEVNPFALGDQGFRHQHIQLGTGTVDPVLQVEAQTTFGEISLEGFAQGQTALYENQHGYRAPWRGQAGTSVGTELVTKLTGLVGLEVLHEGAEEWDGRKLQDGNLGRTELLGTLGLRHSLEAAELLLSVKTTLWRHIVPGDEPPGRLEAPFTLMLGITQPFGT